MTNPAQHEGAIIRPYKGIWPRIGKDVFIAPGAAIIGDVEIGDGASVWFQCVLRGDVAKITVGANTNIQDGSIVHVSRRAPGEAVIGDNVTIGHNVIIHACTLESGCFIGMGAIVMDHSVVESGAMVAAGALVTPRKRIPAGELWGGRPATLMRVLSEEEAAYNGKTIASYQQLAANHLASKN